MRRKPFASEARLVFVVGIFVSLAFVACSSVRQEEQLPELPGPFVVPAQVVPHEAPEEEPALKDWHNVG